MSVPPENLIERPNYRQLLLQQIIESARVINPENGYIECIPLNNRVDPNLLHNWAEATHTYINENFSEEKKPTAIIGIPDRGKEASTALSLQLGIPSLVTHRNPEDASNIDLPNVEYDPK